MSDTGQDSVKVWARWPNGDLTIAETMSISAATAAGMAVSDALCALHELGKDKAWDVICWAAQDTREVAP